MPDSKPTPGQKDVSLLSDEELRIKIAEVCGWEEVVQASMDCWEGRPPVGHEWRAMGHCQIPDYCHDLNAMHEAEEVMTHEQKDECWLRLCREVVPLNQRAWRSTARQRAEAFVLTMTSNP